MLIWQLGENLNPDQWLFLYFLVLLNCWKGRDVNNCLSSEFLEQLLTWNTDNVCSAFAVTALNSALPCLFCTFFPPPTPRKASFCLRSWRDITMMEEKQAASKVKGRLRTQTINSVNMVYTLYKYTHLGLCSLKTLIDKGFQNLLHWFIVFGLNKKPKQRSIAMRHICCYCPHYCHLNQVSPQNNCAGIMPFLF